MASRGVTCLNGREGADVTRKRVVRWAFGGIMGWVQALEELETPEFTSWHCCFLPCVTLG